MTTFTTEDRVNVIIDVEPLEPIPFAGLVDLNKTEKANMSQQAVADELGVTRQTVAYIEEKALNKLRAELLKRGVNKEDLL
jgi:predicted DNA-binding protein (UPF0251 family)